MERDKSMYVRIFLIIIAANGQQLGAGGGLVFRPPGAVTPFGIGNLNLL